MIKFNENLNAKFKAFSYQEEAVNFMKNKAYGAIFHEQGLGKTKIAIDLILHWLKNNELDYVVLVAKKGLVNNWLREINVHSFLNYRIVGADIQQNTKAFTSTCNLIVTHFEGVKFEFKRFQMLCESERVGFILDESTKIKNPESKLTKIFHSLAPLIKKRLILTGTPVANRPYDIWSQIFFLDFGNSLGQNFNDFKKECDLSNDLGEPGDNDINFASAKLSNRQNEFENALISIKNKIGDFAIRENKNNEFIKNKLPEKIFKNIECDWEPSQKELYLKYKKDFGAIIKKEGQVIEDDSEEIIKRLLRLVQIASNPKLIDDNYSNISGKEIILDELIKTIINQHEKVIVWSNFTDNINFFFKKYRHLFPVRIHGKLSMDERNRSVQLFLENADCNLLFATPGAAKEGLTLTVANHAIFYDRGFSLDDYLQAQDRIHRISQEKDCYIYNLIMQDSIDLWIDDLLNTKKYAALLSQGDIELDEYHEYVNYSFSELLKKILYD